MGPVFARAKKTFYVMRCVGDKNQCMECAVHNFKEWSVLGTNPLFGSVPHTNFHIKKRTWEEYVIPGPGPVVRVFRFYVIAYL